MGEASFAGDRQEGMDDLGARADAALARVQRLRAPVSERRIRTSAAADFAGISANLSNPGRAMREPMRTSPSF